MENSCVVCGCYIPEGDHVCKQCLEGSITIKEGSFGNNILVTDEMLKLKLEPVMLSFRNFDVKIENSVLLLENLFKYYVFKTNMNAEGQFNYRFIYENIIPGEEHIRYTADRLLVEYLDVVNTIESMIIKK